MPQRIPQRLPLPLPPTGSDDKAQAAVPDRGAASGRAAPARTTTTEQAAEPGGHAPGTAPSDTLAGSVEDRPSPPLLGTAAPSDATRDLVAQARRDAGAIDRALRKARNPYIVAPPDSPQIRMAQKFREAAALAPNRLWEAPKIVELVNDGGDGARRTRVLTAAGIYCITERSPATSIDMIERHGKQRITNCGHEHEQPANPQEWRTARD